MIFQRLFHFVMAALLTILAIVITMEMINVIAPELQLGWFRSFVNAGAGLGVGVLTAGSLYLNTAAKPDWWAVAGILVVLLLAASSSVLHFPMSIQIEWVGVAMAIGTMLLLCFSTIFHPANRSAVNS